MLFRRLLQAATALVAFAVVISGAVAQEEDKNALILRAMKDSGISSQIRALDQTLLSSLPGDAFPDLQTRSKVAKWMAKAVSQDALLNMVHKSVEEDFNRLAIDQVLVFYSSRLGQKVGRLQSSALEPSLLRNIREGRRTVTSLEGSRLIVLTRIMHSDRIIESNAQLFKSLMRGLIEGFEVQTGDQSRNSNMDVSGLWNSVELPTTRSRDLAMQALANTYQSLSDNELEDLAAYFESDSAEWFRTVVQRGVTKAVYLTARALGTALSNLGGPSQSPGTTK